MATALQIFCWNVNGLAPTLKNINLKYGSLAAFFEHLNADIVCMQEVKLPDAKLSREVVVVEGYQSYWSCSEGKTGYSGVTTWARERWAAVAAEADSLPCASCSEREGRVVMTDHGRFMLLNVYVPNAGERPARPRLAAKLEFLSALQERIDGLLAQGRQVIAVGDFNIAAEQRDVHDAVGWDGLYAPSELAALTALLGSMGDTWRRLHPDATGVYTVWNERTSARSFNVGQRIDYALCSSGLQGLVSSCEVLLDLPPKWSDHAPLLLELQLPDAAGPAAGAAAAAGAGQPARGACPMWQQLLKRFHDPSQRSIAAMFKAAKPRAAPLAAAAAAAATTDPGPAASGEAAEKDGHQSPRAASASKPSLGDAPAAAAADSGDGGRRAGKLARLLDAGDVAAASDAAAAAVPDQQLPQQEQDQQQQNSSGQQAQQAQLLTGGPSASRSTGNSSSSSKRPAAAKPAATRGGRRPPDPKQPKLSAFFAANSNKKATGRSQG